MKRPQTTDGIRWTSQTIPNDADRISAILRTSAVVSERTSDIGHLWHVAKTFMGSTHKDFRCRTSVASQLRNNPIQVLERMSLRCSRTYQNVRRGYVWNVLKNSIFSLWFVCNESKDEHYILRGLFAVRYGRQDRGSRQGLASGDQLRAELMRRRR